MNIHHLELFYYVARHGGITEAVRNIPYGIQQPAVSGQVAQLEEFLAVTLFQRRPFALTPEGSKLYEFIKPFFSELETVATELQGGRSARIRVGASTTVLRDHLPQLLRHLRKGFPNLKIRLREAYQPQLENLLERDELDLAITLIEKKSSPGIHSLPLVRLPIVLLVPLTSPIRSADELWKRDRISEPLISLPSDEAICRNFQQCLAKKNVDWFPAIEVSSIDLIETYVRNGFGIGLSVQEPNGKSPPQLRILPLSDCPSVELGALWRGKPSPLLQTFLEEIKTYSKRLNASGTR
jgi:DNA-binding transcriptional LysR family regulator